MGSADHLLRLDPILTKFNSRFDGLGSPNLDEFLRDRQRLFQQGLMELTNGTKTVIYTGPMASSKSLLALAIGQHYEDLNMSIAYTKPSVDIRDAVVSSRSGVKSSKCFPFDITEESVLLNPSLLIIDEAQFILPDHLLFLLNKRRDFNKRTVVSMLDEDFRGERWETFMELEANSRPLSACILRTYALCSCCGEKATKTQRLVGGNPANYFESQILIGGDEQYEPRCEFHHDVPGKPLDLEVNP